MPVLKVENLRAHYLTRLYGLQSHVKAVDGITLDVEENEIYGIAGESGCGKTTLIKTLTGLVQPPLTIMGGSVRYTLENREIDILSLRRESEARQVRGRLVSYIPQGSMSVLNPVRKIRKSFWDFMSAHRRFAGRGEFQDLVEAHLRSLGLSPAVLKAFPHQLSGGMRQRVTIALATILRPRLILADEPSTALDVIMQRGVIQLLKRIREEMQNTVILVTHDMAIHANICDRVAIMYAGEIVEEAPVSDLFKGARHPYTRFLLRSLPSIGDKTPRVSAPGAPPSLTDPPSGCRFHPRCPEAKELCHVRNPRLVRIGPRHRVACFVDEDTRYER
ncbi:MAG TPA: ABC transporter ATP-binding protein [Spirochaetia bacterium]|nr:ABC transporter ATP-binding protein [Spirochaetia bacterium]